MKKYLFTLILFAFAVISFGQTAFTEAKCTELLQRLEKDPVGFFKTECDPELTFINGNGKLISRTELITIYTNASHKNKREISNLKVRQVGDVGIVTGLLTQISISKSNPETIVGIYKGAFTYTFLQKNDKWLMTSAQHSDYLLPTAEEEIAIKKTIEGEAKSFFDADYKTYQTYWAKVPYASFLYAEGLFVGDALWKKMDEFWINRKPVKIKIARSDWNIRIKGESAFVNLYQTNENLENSTVAESYQEKYLEKISGEWKIVNNTVWNLTKK
jgi:hypothetical protein